MTNEFNKAPAPLIPIDNRLLSGVKIVVEAKLGEAVLTVEELLALKSGSVVALETGLADHVDLYVNDAVVARGEIVAVDDVFGVRIVQLAEGA